MAEFKVSTGRLKRDADNVEGYVQRMKQKLANLENDLSQLDAMWDGPASESFKEAYREDIYALTAVVSNLTKLYGYENMAQEKYEACEQAVLNNVSAL